jgi:peptide chain release factor
MSFKSLRLLSRSFSSITKKVDYSKVPKLVESDLEESFVRGSGPGGQATNTTNNCVILRHKPTNIVVKCHTTRSVQDNMIEARKTLIKKLDEHFNKENSVENQIKMMEKEKNLKNQKRSEKLRQLKKEFKQKMLEEKETNKN